MKQLKIFMLCFLAAFAANTINAQNGVIKEEFITNGELYVECNGDYLTGQIVLEVMTMPHNISYFVRDAKFIGYPSGKEYQISQVSPGWVNYVNHIQVKCDGKLFGVMQCVYHITTNANNEVTVEFLRIKWECKN